MNARRLVMGVTVVLIATVLLVGCPFFFGPGDDGDDTPTKPDLYIVSVQPLKDAQQEVIGVRIVFQNTGSQSITADYAIYFSGDPVISDAADHKIYEGTVTLQADANKQVDVNGETQIQPYIDSHAVTVPDGDYYIGVFVDPDDLIAELDETNNESTSTEIFPFYGDSGGDGYDSTITVRVENGGNFSNGTTCAFAIVPPDGDPGMDALAWGEFSLQSGSGQKVAEHENDQGALEVWYGTDGEYYDIHIFIDADGSGTQSGPSDGDYGSMRQNVLLDGDITESFDAQNEFEPIGSSGDGTLEVDIYNAGNVPNGTYVGFGVCLPGDDSCADPVAYGEFEIRDGYGSAVAQTDDGQGGSVTWYATDGTDYNVFIAVDMDGSGLDQGPRPGDLQGRMTFSIQDGFVSFDAQQDLWAYYGVEAEVNDAADLYTEGVELFFAVTDQGVIPLEENILAASTTTVDSNGNAYTGYLEEYSSVEGGFLGRPWMSSTGAWYDLHVWLERDYDGLPYGYEDYAEGELNNGPIAFALDSNQYFSIHRSELWLGGTVFVNVNDEEDYESNYSLPLYSLDGKSAYFTVTGPEATSYDDPDHQPLAAGSFQVIHEASVGYPDEQFENGESFWLPDMDWHYNAPDGTDVIVWVYVDMDDDDNGAPETDDPSGSMALTIDGNVWADFYFGWLTPFGAF